MADNTDSQKEFDNSGNKSLRVPGFGCPHDFQLNPNARFLNGISDEEQYPRITAREVAMLQVMDHLTDKPDWREKVLDETIVAKWRSEANGMELISEKAFEWCITELRDKATEGDKRFTVTLDAGTRCVKADGLVSEQLHHDLITAVQPLLDAPVKDWHPGSNEQVLNLVHPSLYPLVYGKTRVAQSGQVKLDDILEARNDTFVAPVLSLTEEASELQSDPRSSIFLDIPSSDLAWSRKYQWLPCDIIFPDSQGLDVEITSYINNLAYRGHEKLYRCVEKLISASIPLWNQVLSTAHESSSDHLLAQTPLRIVTRGAEELPLKDRSWIETLPYCEQDVDQEEWDKAVKEVTSYLEKTDQLESSQAADSQEEIPLDWANEWGPRSTAESRFKHIRTIAHPEPFHGCTYEDWKQGNARPFVVPCKTSYGGTGNETSCDPHTRHEVSLESTFRQQGLQIIVKLASIELTPEKPTYGGGNWHLEGMLNEHIVATAIYYFDVENVTESRIRYRQSAVLDQTYLEYSQNDTLPFEIVFGVDDLRDGKQIQEIGSITTTQGRLLVFPNTRQHKVDSFELVDKTKSGHRRFIVLWLVDPHYRVLSTKNVPPQQYDWWKGKMTEMMNSNQYLPADIQNLIDEELKDGTMTRAQAEQYRLELMEERTDSTEGIHENTATYFFCEH